MQVDPIKEHADAFLLLFATLAHAQVHNVRDHLQIAALLAGARDGRTPRGRFFLDVINGAIEGLMLAEYGSADKIPEALRLSLGLLVSRNAIAERQED